MTNIDYLVQEFWRISSDAVTGAPFFEMRRLLKILESCLEVRFDLISVFATAADKDVQPESGSWYDLTRSDGEVEVDDRIRPKFKRMLDGYRKMFDHSLSKSKDMGDILRLLPGVVVQEELSMQDMADLYRIKPDLLECLINFTIEPLRPSPFPISRYYILDDYLSRFLQDGDRSQFYYCNPMLQHISICRQFLSLLDGSNAFELHS